MENNVVCILTNYPLSRSFSERLEGEYGKGMLGISLGELRTRPIGEMIRYLRSLKVSRLLLPVEDENGSALLPVLKLVASAIPAKERWVIDSSLAASRFSRFEAAKSAAKLLSASIDAAAAVMRARRETADLLIKDRVKVSQPALRRILYLNANLWFGVKAGGSVGHISGVVNALLNEGIAVEFVSAGGRLLVDPGARYIRLVPPADFGLPWERNYYRFHFDVVRQAEQVMIGEPVGAIYQRMSMANYSGVALSRKMQVPLILEYNGSEAWIARNWGRPLREQQLAEQVEQVNLRHAHLVVTISDVLRDELRERGVPENRIVTYPNCIDQGMFDPGTFSADASNRLRSRHQISSDAIVVTFVGTFGQWHGAEVLARSIRFLIDSDSDWLLNRKVHFLLVGDGLKMSEVKAILGADANGPLVTLAGLVPQNEAPAYLACSDILVSPHVPNADGSRFFGSPTKLFEYMAMGKAIVASNLDQIGEVLAGSLDAESLAQSPAAVDGTAPAILCKPGSVEQLCASLRFLVEYPSWRETLGANARSLALNKYTWRHHVLAILDGVRIIGGGV